MPIPVLAVLNWDIAEVAAALKMEADEVREYFTDGRRVSFMLERRISREIIKGRLAQSEGASFDLFDSDGAKWEVRSITRTGIYFCPSYMVGSGRAFDEVGFLRKLDEVAGYLVSDVECFPDVPVWKIDGQRVRDWYHGGVLGANTKIPRKRALQLLGD